MICDGTFNFASQQAITGTADVVSTNVYDAGSAIKMFDGSGGRGPIVSVQDTAIGGTSPTLRARFVGADNAGLTSNPIILADSGVSRVLVAGTDEPVPMELRAADQIDAKRYYGVIFTQSGTNPTATVNAQLVMSAQSNLLK